MRTDALSRSMGLFRESENLAKREIPNLQVEDSG